jgi:hypothetical protein
MKREDRDLRTKDTPVLLATPAPDGLSWRCWCPFCKVYHSHSPEPGHRCAHCHTKNSPFTETGYILRRLRVAYGRKS